uniref:Uncharacterized protein n=1 Tax=Schistocephalus solidus TaxID=70667 RepID=A0A0X3PRB2_SCHSO
MGSVTNWKSKISDVQKTVHNTRWTFSLKGYVAALEGLNAMVTSASNVFLQSSRARACRWYKTTADWVGIQRFVSSLYQPNYPGCTRYSIDGKLAPCLGRVIRLLWLQLRAAPTTVGTRQDL